MRTRRLTLVPHMAFPALLTLMVGQMLGLAPDASAQAKKLEGTWRTELTVFDCQTGTPTGATAQILETYLPGGAMLQSSTPTYSALPVTAFGSTRPSGAFLSPSPSSALTQMARKPDEVISQNILNLERTRTNSPRLWSTKPSMPTAI
jgi:hypothetical protein